MTPRIRKYLVYILTSRKHTVLYTCVTIDLIRRCRPHRQGFGSLFTRRYNVNKLVYYEVFKYINEAIAREKQIKGLSRAKKEALIEQVHPGWEELVRKDELISILLKRPRG